MKSFKNENLKWIFKYAKEFKLFYIVCIIITVLDMVTLLGLTGMQKWLIDGIFIEKQFDQLYVLLGIYAAILIFYNIVFYINYMVNTKNLFLIREKILDDMMKFIHSISVKKYQSERIGKFIDHINKDVSNAASTISHFLPRGIVSIIRVIILCIIIGLASPVIFIGSTVISVSYIALGKYFGKRYKEVGKEVKEARSQVTVQTEEGISSTREVVAFNRKQWEKNKYNNVFNCYFNLVMKESKLQNKESLLLEPLRWGISILTLGYGSYLVLQQAMSIGTFVVIFQFTNQLTGAYQSLYTFYTKYQQRMVDIERIRGLVESEDIKKLEEGRKVDSIRTLEFQSVSFKFDDKNDFVLKDLNLSMVAGQKIAFVGASGGGKSTIAQLLIRFFEPTSGVLWVNGEPVENFNLYHYRDKVKIVFQEPYLFPDTIRNNLDMGKNYSEQQIEDVCRLVHIDEFIRQQPKGLETEIGERGIVLSGGQRQRLAIARAILQEPDLLILDEATSALDMETERIVQNNIDDVRKNKTTIIIAHRLSTVENADVIYVMKDGGIFESGSHEQLIAKDSYYRELVTYQYSISQP